MKPICYVHQAFVPDKDKIVTTERCPYFSAYEQTNNNFADEIKIQSTYSKSQVMRRTLQKSFDKCDVPKRKIDDDLQRHVYKLVKEYMWPVLHQPMLRPSDYIDFKSASSPGKLWNLKGCHTKAAAILHPEFMSSVFDTNQLSPIDCNGKTEFLETEVIVNDDKLRTVFNVPIDMIAKQKICWDNQNESLIKSCNKLWTKYGYTKQHGGFTRLCEQFEEFGDIVSEGDSSGYDRNIPLEDTYKLREECLIYDRQNNDVVDFVRTTILYSLKHFILGPDGHLYEKDTGNLSGSNNTASDNSIAHLFVVFRFICKLWLRRFERLPSLKELLEYSFYAIYSDDFTGTHKHILTEGLSLDEYNIIQQENYAEFGLVLKPSQTFTSRNKGRIDPKHSFLGSSFGFSEKFNCYVPIPRMGKLCSSVVFQLEKHTVDQVFHKMVALCVLASPVDWLFTYFNHYLMWLIEHKDLNPEHISYYKHLIFQAKQDSSAWLLFLLGRESGCHFNGKLIFLPPEGGGFKETIMSNGRVTKAERLLSMLAKKTGMTPSGMEWLKAAVDPFHDKQLYVSGYPDMASGNSVVQCLKQQVTITNPGVSATETWDCIIRTSNFLTNSPMLEYFSNNNQIVGSQIGDVQVSSTGGLEIFSGLTGQNLQFNTATNYADNSIAIPDTIIKRRLRVVAQGFEVHNVTSELDKNGSVTTFQQEQSQDLSTWGLANVFPVGGISTTRGWGAVDVIQVQNVPASEAQALLLGGSHTWGASEGCYVVPTMNSLENPPKMASLEQPMFVTNSLGVQLDSGFPSLTNAKVDVPTIDFALNELQPGPIEMQFPIPWNSAGAYFTGLSPNTVLKVNYNVFVERFPSELDTDLVVLSRPTAVFDSVALDAYAECMKLMPCGVPVCENGFGDWFVGGIASIVDKLTGTSWAGNLNKAANEIWTDKPAQQSSSIQAPSTFVEIPRTVQIVSGNPQQGKKMKPLPKIPQKKKKPLPPKPNKK